jgi:hypothetical protein
MQSVPASWSVAFSTSEAIDAALYAQDALALPVAEEIPPLSPSAGEREPEATSDKALICREDVVGNTRLSPPRRWGRSTSTPR